jgi:hypothetical protein
MAGYIGSAASVVSSGAERKKTFTITGSTTSLTGLNYTVGKVHVFQNGVRLVDGTDYTATNGTTITLTVAAQNGDNVVVISQASYQVADAVLTSGDSMTGNLSLGDNNKVIFGAGSDLQIYHDGSHSYIAEGGSATGSLRIRGENLLLEDNSGKDYLNAVADAQVELSHNGVKKFETTSTGIQVTGNIANASGDFTLDVAGNISLDADGGNVRFKDGGTEYGTINKNGTANLSIYSSASDADILFQGNDGGSVITAMTLDMSAGGFVGIGTSSPATNLQIKGAVNSSQLILGGTDNRGLKISTTNEGGQNDGSVIFDAQDTEGSAVNSHLIFSTGGTQRMRVAGSGSVAIGATNPTRHGQTTKTLIYNGSTTTSDFALHVGRLTAGSENVVCISNGYGKVGSITTSGASTAYNTSSDYRLKENVVDLTGASARVNQLNPSRFNFIADDTNTLVDGFLAHEVATVVPEAINGTKDAMKDEEYEVTPAVLDDDGNVTTEAVMGTRSVPDYQGIDQSKLVPLLTAALQEALTEIASLKTRVQALEA